MSSYAPWVTPFLQHLKQTANMAASCRAVGVSYTNMTALKQRDADFAAAVDDSLEQAYDYLEAECRRRAFEGVEEPVVYQGQLTPVFERNPDGTVRTDLDTGLPVQATNQDGTPKFLAIRKYSDSMAMFLMKGYRRRMFGDKTEITGANGGALAVIDETKRSARVAALLAIAQERKAKGVPDDDLSDLA